MTQPVQDYSYATSTSVEIYTNRFEQLEWIFAETFNVPATILVSWVALSLIAYGQHTDKWRKENRLNPTQIDAGIVYTLAVFTTICGFIRLATNQVVFNFGYTDKSSLRCEVGTAISLVFYFLSTDGSYMFLWFRQRSLYRHPSMEELNKRWMKRLAFITFILILLNPLFLLACTLATGRFIPTGQGCIKSAGDHRLPLWPYYVIISFDTFAQVSILFLLLYPLFVNISCSNADRVMKIVKRSAIFAGICVSSDAIAMAIAIMVASDKTLLITVLTVYDINMIVNIASVFFSFGSWKKIFVAPFVSCLPSKTNDHSEQTKVYTTSVTSCAHAV